MKPSSKAYRSGGLVALIITTVSSFLIPFMGISTIIALPAIGRDFQMNAVTLAWVTTAYILTSATLLIPLGRLSDIWGRKRIFLIGYIIFFIGSVISATASTSALFLASRAVQGVGSAAILSTSIAILTAAFPKNHRGRVIGITTAAVYIGLSLGPVLGGLLTEYLGWRSIFWSSSVLCLMMTAAVLWKLPEYGETRKEPFDLAGTVIYSGSLMSTMYGLSLLPDATGAAMIAGGIAGAALFVWWERRTPVPLIDFRLFIGNRGFTFSSLAALVHYSGTWAISFLLSLLLQYAKDLTPGQAGLILITSPVVQAVFSPLFGRLSDRIEPRLLASVGMAVTAVGIGMLVFVTAATSTVYIITTLMIIGFGFALFSSPNTNAIMSSVDQRSYGFASATVGTMRQLGMTLSMGMTMVVFALVIGKVEITPEHYPSFMTSVRIVFLISSLLCFSAIFPSMARGKIHEEISSARDSGA